MPTILVVDDERPIRDLISTVLQSAGHRVIVANHGREALRICAAEKPALIVSDVMMPVMDGIELCRRVKAGEAGAAVPVILMSAVAPRLAQQAGPEAFLPKPFDLDDMERLIADCLGRTARA